MTKVAALFRELAKVELNPVIVAQVIARASGLPALISVYAGVVRTSGEKGLEQILKGPMYDIGEVATAKQILTLAKPRLITASEALIQALQKKPESIYELPSRKFEEILAELLDDQGMQVELTQATRDGGRDIIASMDTPAGPVLCLVEAKRYRADRKIGVGLVRQLRGALDDHDATNAMMVTTSSYSRDARAFQERHKYRLHLREYTDLVTWIQNYKQKKFVH